MSNFIVLSSRGPIGLNSDGVCAPVATNTPIPAFATLEEATAVGQAWSRPGVKGRPRHVTVFAVLDPKPVKKARKR